MRDKNELFYTMRELCGERTNQGYFLDVNGTMVPNFLNKDDKVEYPEIRISHLDDKEKHEYSNRCSQYQELNSIVYDSRFQFDIFSRKIEEMNDIADALKTRIDSFFDAKTFTASYDEDLIFQDGYYYDKNYGVNETKIGKIEIDNKLLKKVFKFADLVDETWFLGKEALYIKTKKNIENVKIMCVSYGNVFYNGDTKETRGLINVIDENTSITSRLEQNAVERTTIRLRFTYSIDKYRKLSPIIDKIKVRTE